MKTNKEDGMTILEVVIAITILLMGTVFVAQSNSLSYRFLGQQELRQQMVFFAAGAMEAALEAALEGENEDLTSGRITAKASLDVHIPELLPRGLTPFKVTASVNSPNISDVEMYNYRYNYDEK
ncbi:type IV pilus modification PilV family protein [Desulfosporosinus nitroreducens]|uniref:type IV pilus modification PilV family protein n=1 Tax=Desulfosporosinus nitroreducens TaxID=2018668 RepID=UPI00207C568A|nr:type II secretion system protein [Desulfosporosinus nitroreducens]MCO1600093.1 type II secretion system GspH family protein [Desulfosporosinus nitroreducens]